jgi:hypothetical protein
MPALWLRLAELAACIDTLLAPRCSHSLAFQPSGLGGRTVSGLSALSTYGLSLPSLLVAVSLRMELAMANLGRSI